MKTDLNESRVKVTTLLNVFGSQISTNLGKAIITGVNCNVVTEDNPNWMASKASYDDCSITFLLEGGSRSVSVNDFELSISVGWFVKFIE